MADRDGELSGIITSRRCPLCGHHEMGLETEDGVFHPLRPGTRIQIIESALESHRLGNEEITTADEVVSGEDAVGYTFWIPDPAISKKKLRLKYGVRIRSDLPGVDMTPELYRVVYLDKLEDLIAKEIYIPIPVILDRFFASPHLASGNPRQVAEAMWKELEEVREPFHRVERWLTSREPSIFVEEMGAADPSEKVPGKELDQVEILRELEDLSLEEFLSML